MKIPIPILTVSEANRRDHWAVRARRTKTHRRITDQVVSALLPRKIKQKGKITISLTRLGTRILDSDNLVASTKGCRDGIADALGRDDGDPGLTWRYFQRLVKRGEEGVEVEIR